VVNLNFSEVMDRVMLTGRHMVRSGAGHWLGNNLNYHQFSRDVFCKNCDAKLGWMYEFATEDTQRSSNMSYTALESPIKSALTRYKEGRVILERALVQECDGIEEHPITD
jgi:hypothetical protein